MIFGDTTVYKGKRFEIKQNLIYKSEFTNKTLIFNTWTSMSHQRNTNGSSEFEKIQVNIKSTSCSEDSNDDHEKNKIKQDVLVSHDRNRALHDSEKQN